MISTLWLIPARSGSKGIPDKNIKPFCGESLTKRALRLALSLANPQDTVFLSTDSGRIQQEAEDLGLPTPFPRPLQLAQDSSSSYDVMLHVIEEFKARGKEFDRLIFLQPTSPFRLPEDVLKASQLWRPDIDMVVSVCNSSANPYYNLFEEDPDGFLKISKGEGNYTRRQDAPKVWEYNGAIYVISVPSLLKSPLSKFAKIIPYEMPSSRSLDLDTPADWVIAENLFKSLNL